jgi:hypothetical protein
MLNVLIQSARPNKGRSIASMFLHLGALGLFFLAILDSSPLPTFGEADILTAILAAAHQYFQSGFRVTARFHQLLCLHNHTSTVFSKAWDVHGKTDSLPRCD